MSEMIKVLCCYPGRKPELATISNDVADVEKLIEGTYCLLELGDGLAAVFDEDGNKKVKDLNRVIDGGPIFGLCIFCCHEEKVMKSLREEDILDMERLLA